jgi:hypothetical protein
MIIEISYKTQETYTFLQSHEEESGFASSTRPTHISPYFTN